MRRAQKEDPSKFKLNESAKQSIQQVLERRKKEAMRMKHTATVTKLAQAMRFFICNKIKLYLTRGDIKSKFFHQFEMCDVISPKCFVVLHSSNVALMPDGKARKMVFKVLNSENILQGCGTLNPSETQIRSIIDDWIYMAPKSVNIVQAYEIFKDDMFIMQLTEYCEQYDNLYDAVKLMNLAPIVDQVPMSFVQFVYKYVIQISHAFMNAHRASLIHSDFNLTQVICDDDHSNFKLINFRPWNISKFNCQETKMFDRSELLQIAKASDLYHFGCSIFELMCGKTHTEHHSSQQELNKHLNSHRSSVDSAAEGLNLPQISQIPFAWMRLSEAQCLIQALHTCMLIDTNRDTVHLFNQIHQSVARQYKKYFDARFTPLPDHLNISMLQKALDTAVGMNNRQVISRFKLQNPRLNKVVSDAWNKQIQGFQMDLLEKCCSLRYVPDEAFLNLSLLKWQQGHLFDEEFCQEIQRKIYDKPTAWWICLVFRKALGLPVAAEDEAQVLKSPVSTLLGGLLAEQYKDLDLRKNVTLLNFDAPLPKLLGYNELAHVQVKKIFFSANEKFCVILTTDAACVVEITKQSFKLVSQIPLPYQEEGPILSDRNSDTVIQGMSSEGDETTVMKDLLSSPRQKEEQANLNRRERLRCNGFFASPWVAAIDDEGQNVVLHKVDATELVPRTEDDDQFDYLASNSDRIFTTDNHLSQNFPGMRLQSDIFVYNGPYYRSCKRIDIGRQCPDEIIDICIFQQTLPDEESKPFPQSQKEEERISLTNPHSRLSRNEQTKLQLFQPTDADSKASRATPTTDIFNLPLNVSMANLGNPYIKIVTSSDQSRSTPAEEGKCLQLVIKCKDLQQYNLVIEPTGLVSLAGFPEPLPGGAAIPVSIFNLPYGTDKEQAEIENFQNIQSRLTQLVQDTSLEEPNYISGHYEHVKEFIERHEKIGNIVKFARDNNRHAIGFQHCEYGGLKPHFFVYDIHKRAVVRRFQHFSKSFTFTDSPFEDFVKINFGTQLLSGVTETRREETQLELLSEQYENRLNQMLSDDLYFEVSPQGNFMVCVYDGTLSVKQLQPPAELADMLHPAYFAQEHQQIAQIMGDHTDLSPHSSPSKRGDLGHQIHSRKTEFPEYEKLDPTKTLAEQLITALYDFRSYIGSTHQKHLKLMKLQHLIAKSLEYPESLVNPGAAQLVMHQLRTEITQADSPKGHQMLRLPIKKKGIIQKETSLMKDERRNPGRLLKRCFFAIRLFHFHFSQLTPPGTLGSHLNNIFSQKVSIQSIKQFTSFDQVAFQSTNEKIKQFQMCSLPEKMMFAVHFSRVLQIYDIVTGNQIFELCVPSARKIFLLDQEQCIVVQEGNSTVIVGSIQSQKKSFGSKDIIEKAVPKLRVEQYEENEKFDEYKLGLAHHRLAVNQQADSESEGEETVEEDIKGTVNINWDEDIINLVTSRNTAAVGYLALIGSTKTTILLAYADEDSCHVDHIWTLNYTDFIGKGFGLSIKTLDFSNNCENFIAYTNSGSIIQWDIKNLRFDRKIYTVAIKDRPIASLRSLNNSQTIVTYSRQQNLFMVIDAHGLNHIEQGKTPDNFVIRIHPDKDGFGRALNFQVDISEQFLVCAFEQCKVGVYNLKTGLLVMKHENPSFFCEGSFIDETGCYMATLDEHQRFVNIHTLQWTYQLETPSQPKQKNKQEELQAILKKQQEEAERLKLAKSGQSSATTKLCALF